MSTIRQIAPYLSSFAGVLLMLAPQAAPAQVGWHNGECQSAIPGQGNWYVSYGDFARTYDDFVVPAGGWTVSGVYSHNSMVVEGVTEAAWEIRGGVSTGNPGVIAASGRSPATQKLLATRPDHRHTYRIEVTGLAVWLEPGIYWLNVSPIVSGAAAAPRPPSYVCATLGAGAIGNPRGNNGSSFFYSCAQSSVLFRPVQNTGDGGTSGDFSHGVLVCAGCAPANVSISAVVNSAGWQPGPIAPGELVTIAGTGLGPATPSTLVADDAGRVSSSLNGVQVLFNGIAAPAIYAGSAQINAVVPYELAGAASASVQIRTANRTSNAFPVAIAAAAPALFTADGSGAGPAAALNEDFTYNGPSHPAAKGSLVVLYLTGEGQTNPGGVTGKITMPSAVPPLTPQPVLPVSVQIGGQSAMVAYYGEAPGMVSGVMQVNVQIPVGAASGNLPAIVTVGGAKTQDGVTVSVK